MKPIIQYRPYDVMFARDEEEVSCTLKLPFKEDQRERLLNSKKPLTLEASAIKY